LVFRDKYHPQVKKDLRKIDTSVQESIKNLHIPKILDNPYSAEKLIGDLSGIYSYHFKKGNAQYRISYTIDKTEKIVYILMIGKRENFYQILRRRL